MPLLEGYVPLMPESREEVRFPADEAFWEDFKILTSRSKEARDPPRFLLRADHKPDEMIEANRYWVAGYLNRWQQEHPHQVAIRTENENETFCASDEFWRRIEKSLRSGTDGEVVVSRNEGENFTTTKAEWEGFIRTWEQEQNATPQQRQAESADATRLLQQVQSNPAKDGYTNMPIPHMTLEPSALEASDLDAPAPMVSPDVNFNKCFRRFVAWIPASQDPPLVDVKLEGGVITVSQRFFNRFMGAWQRQFPLSITVATRENSNIEVDVFRAHEALWHEIVMRSVEASEQDQQQIPPDVYLASIVDKDVPPRVLSKQAYMTVVKMWPDHHPHHKPLVPLEERKKKSPVAPCVRLPKPNDHNRRKREPGAPRKSDKKHMPVVTLCLHRDVFDGFNQVTESDVITTVRENPPTPYLSSVHSNSRYATPSLKSDKSVGRYSSRVPTVNSLKSFIVPQLEPSTPSVRSVTTPFRSGATTVPSAPSTPPRRPPSSTCSI